MNVRSRVPADDFSCKKLFGPEQLENVVDDICSATKDP